MLPVTPRFEHFRFPEKRLRGCAGGDQSPVLVPHLTRERFKHAQRWRQSVKPESNRPFPGYGPDALTRRATHRGELPLLNQRRFVPSHFILSPLVNLDTAAKVVSVGDSMISAAVDVRIGTCGCRFVVLVNEPVGGGHCLVKSVVSLAVSQRK